MNAREKGEISYLLELINLGSYNTAIESANDFLRQLNNSLESNYRVHMICGGAYYKVRNYAAASKEFGKAEELVNEFPFLSNIKIQIEVNIQPVETIATPPATPSAPIDEPDPLTRAKKLFDTGVALYKKGEYQNAILYLNNVIQLNPEYPRAYHFLGASHYKLKNAEEAIKNLALAINLEPNSASNYNLRSLVYYCLQNKLNESLIDANKAIELNANESIYFSNRADILYRLNRFQDAILDSNAAIALNSKNYEAYFHRGLSHFKLRLFSDALADFSSVIELQPSSVNVYRHRALVYHLAGKPLLAFEDEKKAQQLEKVPSLKNVCKFFILNNHARLIARNSVRHFVQSTAVEKFTTDALRYTLEEIGITPDIIDLVRKEQGLITGTPTLFDEIRKEEEFYLQVDGKESVIPKMK